MHSMFMYLFIKIIQSSSRLIKYSNISGHIIYALNQIMALKTILVLKFILQT